MTAPAPAPKKDRTAIWILLAAGCGGLLCIVSILAAIAIPAFIKYVKKSKASEGRVSVREIGHRLESRCADSLDGRWTVDAAGPLPARPSSMAQTPSWSSDPGFSALGFDPGVPVYFSYEISSRGEDRIVRGYGDLDDDGVLSTYEIQCYAGCRCDARPHVVNELE